MLKQIILGFLLLLSINLSAQHVSFEPVFINQTTRKIDTTIIFTIYNQNDSGIAWNEFSNIIELPDTGKYKMAIIMSGVVYDIDINKYGYFSDTFNTPLIHVKAVIGEHLPTRYYYYDYKYYGDSACDGYITDFYYNGNIRLIGRFTNGHPIDTLKEYYENGVLKCLDYYSHNKIVQINQPYPYRAYYHCAKHFDREGRLVWESNNKTGKEIHYGPNGNLKEIIDTIKQDTSIVLNNGIYQLELVTIIFNGTLKERWVEYGFLSPLILDQYLIFYKNGKIIKKHVIPIKKVEQETTKYGMLSLVSIPVFDIHLLKGDNIDIYGVYGSNYCCGINCPEFLGYYNMEGKIITEHITTTNYFSGENLSDFLSKYKIDINKPNTSLSILNLFTIEQ